MAKYRRKPVIIEAWQWTGKTHVDASWFAEQNGLPMWNICYFNGVAGLVIPTLEGHDLVAQTGDYIIRGNDGFYPCRPDVFEEKYEPLLEFDIYGLVCPDCGRLETTPYRIGDKCICGGTFIAR